MELDELVQDYTEKIEVGANPYLNDFIVNVFMVKFGTFFYKQIISSNFLFQIKLIFHQVESEISNNQICDYLTFFGIF